MKKKDISALILLALAALFSGSCTKVLEEEPKNSTYVGEFWQSSDDINSAVAGNYALLRDAITSGNWKNVPRYFVYGDGVPANYFTIQYDGDGLEAVQTGDFTGQYNIESYGDWTKYYKVIAMSNLLLERVTNMDVSKFTKVDDPVSFKNKALGQAYFIRALSYFFLTRIWGDVPLVTSTDEDPIAANFLGKTPKKEIMMQIENDCHQAEKLLSWTYSNSLEAKVTANKGSVYALLAHLYLWRATTSNVATSEPIMSDVNSADTTITKLKAMGGYRQVDTAAYYNTFIGKSSEGIFEIAASEVYLEGSSTHIASFFLRQADIRFNSATYSRFFVKPEYLSTHFSKEFLGYGWVWNTQALEWQWIEHPAAVGETVYIYPNGVEQEVTVTASMLKDSTDIRNRKNFTDLSIPQPTCVKYHNVNYRNNNSAYISNNIIIFRYSDMLLLEAEIALYRGDISKATNIINGFRIRNGGQQLVKPNLSKDEVMYQYALERGKEMYLEGHLYYDLIRTRQYPRFITWLSESRFKQEGFYWPIAPALFKNNPNLGQTSYWVGKI